MNEELSPQQSRSAEWSIKGHPTPGTDITRLGIASDQRLRPLQFRGRFEMPNTGIVAPNGSRLDIITEVSFDKAKDLRSWRMGGSNRQSQVLNLVRFPDHIDCQDAKADIAWLRDALSSSLNPEDVSEKVKAEIFGLPFSIEYRSQLDPLFEELDVYGEDERQTLQELIGQFKESVEVDPRQQQITFQTSRVANWFKQQEELINANSRQLNEWLELYSNKFRATQTTREIINNIAHSGQVSEHDKALLRNALISDLDTISRYDFEPQRQLSFNDTSQIVESSRAYFGFTSRLEGTQLIQLEHTQTGIPTGYSQEGVSLLDIDASAERREALEGQQFNQHAAREIILACLKLLAEDEDTHKAKSNALPKAPIPTGRKANTPPGPLRRKYSPTAHDKLAVSTAARETARFISRHTALATMAAIAMAGAWTASSKAVSHAFDSIRGEDAAASSETGPPANPSHPGIGFLEQEPSTTPYWQLRPNADNQSGVSGYYGQDYFQYVDGAYRQLPEDPLGSLFSTEEIENIGDIINIANLSTNDQLNIPTPDGYVIAANKANGQAYKIDRYGNSYSANTASVASFEGDDFFLVQKDNLQPPVEYYQPDNIQEYQSEVLAARQEIASILNIDVRFTPQELATAMRDSMEYSIYDKTDGKFFEAETPIERLRALKESGFSLCNTSNSVLLELLSIVEPTGDFYLVEGYANRRDEDVIHLSADERHSWVIDWQGQRFDATPFGATIGQVEVLDPDRDTDELFEISKKQLATAVAAIALAAGGGLLSVEATSRRRHNRLDRAEESVGYLQKIVEEHPNSDLANQGDFLKIVQAYFEMEFLTYAPSGTKPPSKIAEVDIQAFGTDVEKNILRLHHWLEGNQLQYSKLSGAQLKILNDVAFRANEMTQ